MSSHRVETPDPPAHAVAAVVHPDPYPYYQTLRETRPLYWDNELGLWVGSSHAAVHAGLAHTGLRVRPPAEPVPRALQGTAAGEVFACLVRMNDGAFHAAHKPSVTAAAKQFDGERVAGASCTALAALLPQLDANALLTALPIRVMAILLGVADERLDEVTVRVQDFVRGIAAGASPESVRLASDAADMLMGMWDTSLGRAAAANRIGFMQQSVDATAGLLGNTALLLQHRPELVAKVAESDETARRLVAEVARWDAPVQNTRRWAAEDVVVLGQSIAKGQCLLLVLASANRDSALNPDPDVFKIERDARRSMTFGTGVHACPGEAIAIEIVAAAARQLCLAGQLEDCFGLLEGYAALPNARIPVFAQARRRGGA